MNFKEIQEMRKINKMKERLDCLNCEIIVPVEMNESPIIAIMRK